jgi:hypothetical protein
LKKKTEIQSRGTTELVVFLFLTLGAIMPEDFLKCVSDGGHVITVKHGEKKYQHVCYDKNGKPHYGEIKEKKKPEPKKHKAKKSG